MRESRLKIIVFSAVMIAVFAVAFNIPVTSQKGVNYSVQTIKIPLYLKVLDFFDRHYNYKVLVEKITENSKGEEERAKRILKWTLANIRENPSGLPVIDDHVWHIIVRGYGVDDQFQDVFTTLCSYAGLNAFFDWVQPAGASKKALSFVRLKGRWSAFDVYNGTYFIRKDDGEIANIDDLMSGNWRPVSISSEKIPDYSEYVKYLKTIDYDHWFYKRAAIQSPIKRFIYWLKKE